MVAAVCIILAGAPPVQAWSKAGHMLSGAIAYYELRDKSSDALAKTIEALESHPEFDSRWAEKLDHVADDKRDVVLFMLAARWADDIRGNEDYDRPYSHFINYPFKPASAPEDLQVAQPADENLLLAYREHLETLEEGDEEEKAIALCWLFHLFGDCHQPLHTAALFNETFRNGDRGGTTFYVKLTPDGNAVSLHSVWDGAVINSSNYDTVITQANALRTQFPNGDLGQLAPEFVPTDFDKWLKDESFELAKTAAYKNGTLPGGKKKSQAKLLSADYVLEMKPIAQKRMVLSGKRLAALLAKELD